MVIFIKRNGLANGIHHLIFRGHEFMLAIVECSLYRPYTQSNLTLRPDPLVEAGPACDEYEGSRWRLQCINMVQKTNTRKFVFHSI